MTMSLPKRWEFSAILKRARTQAEYFQHEVADYIGISRWTYVSAENGQSEFREEWVYRLPLEMRTPEVVRFFQREHEEDIEELDKLLDKPVRRIARPTASGVL